MAAIDILGMKVRLDRAVDRQHGCHDNVALICPGKGPHAAQLLCIECRRHRGWLPQGVAAFLSETVRCFGVQSEPLFTIQDSTAPAIAQKGAEQMHIDEMYPSRWLKAADLGGEDVTFKIKAITRERVGRDDGDDKNVVAFVGESKKFVLNVTNGRAIAKLHGPDSRDWVGKPVTLYPTTTDFAGEETECIRVRAPEESKSSAAGAAAKKKKSLKDDLGDEIII